MKPVLPTVAAILLAGFTLRLAGGSIEGSVAAQGPAGASTTSNDDMYSSHRYRLAPRVDYARLNDFIIYIDQPVADPGAPPPPTATVSQYNVSFEPKVLAIQVGTRVRFPNRDHIFHNVFSMSDPKPFDLGMYTSEDKPQEVLFDKVGRVDVYCSIHSNMHCIIWVLPNRFFAKSDARNHYEIHGVPAGTYRLRAWQERMPFEVREVTVPAEGRVTVNFILSLKDLPKY